MKCLYCSDVALPDKALCANCYPLWVKENQRQSKEWEARDLERIGASVRTELPSAPHVARAIAWLIDLMLLALISGALLLPTATLVGASEAVIGTLRQYAGDPYHLHDVDHILYTLIKVTLLCYLVPAWYYFALSEHSLGGATPGKLLMGLSVRPQTGTLTLNAASGRFAFRALPFVLPLLMLPQFFTILPVTTPVLVRKVVVVSFLLLVIITVLDFAMALLTSSRMALHDFATGTEVVQVKPFGFRRVLVAIIVISLLGLAYLGAEVGKSVLNYSLLR